MQRLVVAAVCTALSIPLVAVAPAGAVTMRTCPDGTKVPDSRPCPKKSGGLKVRTQAGPSQGRAPKPKDSTKKWRDYILGNPKPPIRPKR